MAAHKTHTKKQTAALQAEIYKRYCCGQSQQTIADALGLAQSAVSYHLKHAREAIRLEIELRRSDRLRELERIREEAWAAWETDKSPAGTAFLTQVQKAIARECAMLGLDAAKSVSASVAFSELPHDTLDSVIGAPQEP